MLPPPTASKAPNRIPPFDPGDAHALNVIIETPKGSPSKYAYDPEHGLFKLRHVLTAGATFPFDFGYVPSTKGPDGDPLDVLVLMDSPAFAGCWIPCRLVGVIEAEQREGTARPIRNDRLIAVAQVSQRHESVKELSDLPKELLKEIEQFFIFYNEARGKRFKPLGQHGTKQARKVVQKAMVNSH